MTGSTHYQYILFGHIVILVEIFRDGHVLIRHDTFSSTQQYLVLQRGGQFLQMLLQVGRRDSQHQYVRVLHHQVDVRREMDAVHVKGHICQVGRIMSQFDEIGNSVITAHVPVYLRLFLQKYLGNGRSPTASTEYGYPHAHPSILLCHSVTSATVGLVSSSLYFLFTPQMSMCSFCGFTSFISLTRL